MTFCCLSDAARLFKNYNVVDARSFKETEGESCIIRLIFDKHSRIGA